MAEVGVNINFVDENGNTALHLAACSGELEEVKYLVNKIDINIKNNEGYTPLDIAMKSGKNDIIKVLSEKIIEESFEILRNEEDQQSDDTGSKLTFMDATLYKDYSKPLSKEDIQTILDLTYVRECRKQVFKAIEIKDIKDIELPRNFTVFILNLDQDHWITLFVFNINKEKFKACYIDSLRKKIPDNICTAFNERGVEISEIQFKPQNKIHEPEISEIEFKPEDEMHDPEICEMQLKPQNKIYDSGIFSLKYAEIIIDDIIAEVLNCKICKLKTMDFFSMEKGEMIPFFKNKETLKELLVKMCKECKKKKYNRAISSQRIETINSFASEGKMKEKLEKSEIILDKEREFFANMLCEKKKI